MIPASASDSRLSELIFTLDGPTRYLFAIDENGILRTTQTLDFEKQSSHWVGVVARNDAVEGMIVGRMEVLVTLTDVNECVPLTTEPMYTTQVAENTGPGIPILKIDAFDCDGSNRLTFAIQGSATPYFEIMPNSGLITTTSIPLDREEQSEHILEVAVFDNGSPSLNSTTIVVVKVTDVNDVRPAFLLRSGSVQAIPEYRRTGLQEDDPSEDNKSDDNWLDAEEFEEAAKWSEWESMDGLDQGSSSGEQLWRRIFRAVAYDPDAGENGTVTYKLKYRANSGIEPALEEGSFTIDGQTGEIYTSAGSLKGGTVLKFMIEASDQGSPKTLKSTMEVILKVKSATSSPSEGPVTIAGHQQPPPVVSLTTKEKPGYTVETLESFDPDGDQLWYEIISGDDDKNFMLLPESQNVILARRIHREEKFQLNISISDGYNNLYVPVSTFPCNKQNFVLYLAYRDTPFCQFAIQMCLS